MILARRGQSEGLRRASLV